MLFNLRLIPLLPFVGAAILIIFGRKWSRPWVHLIATLAIGASCVVSLDAFFVYLPEVSATGGLIDPVYTWMASGDLTVPLALRMDSLSGLLCLVITFIGTLIHIYSTGYMSHDTDYARFFAYLNLFCGAMLVLVLGDSLPVMFIGWEGVGLCSYLLIGFWYGEKPNADAGKKAFITNRVGDFGFLLGMFLLFYATGTLDIPELVGTAKVPGGPLHQELWGQPIAFWACFFLFVGAAGKSAQIPLYVWLPDAMAGPTPVSALIHAATMVTAGVYMVARLGAVYLVDPAALVIVALVGAATALFAAIIGFAQNDFKKVLAYSTVSQLGFMFAGVGVGAFHAGVFHLFTHAFFKAGLFLCAGSVMHAMSGSGDISKMGGLRKYLPYTHAVFWVCWLAILGLPPFSGFFSKDAIVAAAFGTHTFDALGLAWVGPVVGVVLVLAALCTAFYMSRLYYLVFSGDLRADEHTRAHIHESPVEMVGPLVVLAVGAALGGLIGIPPALTFGNDVNWLGHWLTPALGAELHVSHALEYGAIGVSVTVALVGWLSARAIYRNGYGEPAQKFAASLPGFVALVRDKFRVDELYDLIIIRPIKALSRGLFLVVDRVLIDQVMVHGVALVVDVFGRIARTFQVGDVQRYLAAFAIGLFALFYLAVKPPPPDELKVQVRGATVDVDAGAGAPAGRALQYDFDFDEDGYADKSGRSPKARFSYEGRGNYTIKVTIRDERWNSSRTVSKTVEIH